MIGRSRVALVTFVLGWLAWVTPLYAQTEPAVTTPTSTVTIEAENNSADAGEPVALDASVAVQDAEVLPVVPPPVATAAPDAGLAVVEPPAESEARITRRIVEFFSGVTTFVGPPAPPGPPDHTADAGVGSDAAQAAPTTTTRPAARSSGGSLAAIFWMVAVSFLLLRGLAWLVRRSAAGGSRAAAMIRRVWPLLEAPVWMIIAVWIVLGSKGSDRTTVAVTAGVVLVALVLVGWNAFHDVVAGLVLTAERGFDVGDYLRLPELEGQVVSFRTRVLELRTPNGNTAVVPYRQVAGAANIRAGGRRTAHAVSLSLEIPASLDPAEALRAAKEMAMCSPWSVLGVVPRLELIEGTAEGPRVSLEAYAFDKEACPKLHAELLSGWQRMTKKGGEARPAPGA